MTVRRPRLVAAAYVAVVTGLAAIGAFSDSSWSLAGAALLSLPVSVVATVGYYLAYGLLAKVPGASPDLVSGSASCTAADVCRGTPTGGLAPWFSVTTDLVAVALLAAAAVADVVLVTSASRWLRSRSGGSGRRTSEPLP